MFSRTRLTSWSLALLLFGVPLLAALALEHAGTSGQRAASARKPKASAAVTSVSGSARITSPSTR